MFPLYKSIPRRMKSPRYFLIIILALGVLLLVINFPLYPYLVVQDGKTNAILYKTPVSFEDTFVLRYIHSINRTPVEEFYRINPDLSLLLYELRFDTYSVGMPSDLNKGEKLEIKDGKFIIKNMERSLPVIDLRIGQVIANHSLILADKEIILAEVAEPGTYVKIKAMKLNMLNIWGMPLYER